MTQLLMIGKLDRNFHPQHNVNSQSELVIFAANSSNLLVGRGGRWLHHSLQEGVHHFDRVSQITNNTWVDDRREVGKFGRGGRLMAASSAWLGVK